MLCRNILLFIMLVSLGGCAKAWIAPQGETPTADLEIVMLRSQPPGASARLSTGESCQTPCSVKKPRDSKFSVTFEKNGYSPKTVDVSNNLELLKKFNSKNKSNREDIEQIQVRSLRLTPNPVIVTLDPAWSKD
jgi:hypothetical protein